MTIGDERSRRVAGIKEGLEIARELANGQFGFDISVWVNATKKEMCERMALAIVSAIDARLAALAKEASV